MRLPTHENTNWSIALLLALGLTPIFTVYRCSAQSERCIDLRGNTDGSGSCEFQKPAKPPEKKD